MFRSCKKCGFFVSNSNSPTKYIGYCLFFDPKDIEEEESAKKLKIIDGGESPLGRRSGTLIFGLASCNIIHPHNYMG